MDTIRVTKKEEFEYIQFNKLLEFDNLVHAFSLRTYDTGFRRKEPNNIGKNLQKLCNEFNITEQQILQPNQNHRDNILEFVNKEQADKILENEIIDGIIMNKPNFATILTAADCMPIMFYDPANKVFANIHSGWRGTVKRIGVKAVDIMIKKYGSKPTNIICCIAPCIHKDHFLVNDDVMNLYLNEFKDKCVKSNIIEKTDLQNEKGPMYRIDNIELYKILLKEMGLLDKNIIDSGLCTVCRKDKFYSKRGDHELINTNGLFMMLK